MVIELDTFSRCCWINWCEDSSFLTLTSWGRCLNVQIVTCEEKTLLLKALDKVLLLMKKENVFLFLHKKQKFKVFIKTASLRRFNEY